MPCFVAGGQGILCAHQVHFGLTAGCGFSAIGLDAAFTWPSFFYKDDHQIGMHWMDLSEGGVAVKPGCVAKRGINWHRPIEHLRDLCEPSGGVPVSTCAPSQWASQVESISHPAQPPCHLCLPDYHVLILSRNWAKFVSGTNRKRTLNLLPLT